MTTLTLPQFKDFVTAGVTTAAGFDVDTESLVYNLNPDGSLGSVRGTVKAANPDVVNFGFNIQRNTPTVLRDRVVIWDATGKPVNAPPALALVSVAK